MRNIGKKSYWRIIFNITLIIYIINVLSIMFRGNVLFLKSISLYNYLSIVLSGVFMFIFYQFLKKGALTVKYLLIMFSGLVIFPLLVFVFAGGVKF